MVFDKNAIYTFETYDIVLPEQVLIKLEDGLKTKKPQLLTIDASHYAFFNGNGCIYRHDTVQYDIPSFVSPRPKPIIEAHRPKTSDVFGRVVAADYKLTDYYHLFAKDYDLDDLSTEEYIQFCKDVLVPYQKQNPQYNGLSYVQVIGKLDHEQAIKKVLDKEFITVSIGAVPKRMICSECLQDQTERMCSHYVSKRNGIFMLAESVEYEELSFVRKPADPFGRVVRIHDGQMEEFTFERESTVLEANVGVLDTESFFNNINADKKIVCVDNVCTIINDNQEDNEMDKKNISLVAEFGEEKIASLSIKLTDSEEEVSLEAYQITDEEFEGMKNTEFAIIQKTDEGEVRRFPLNNEANVRAGLALIADAENLTEAERKKADSRLAKAAKKFKVTIEDSAEEGDVEGGDTQKYNVEDIDKILTELKTHISTFKEEIVASLNDSVDGAPDVSKDPVAKIFDLLKWFASDVSYAGAALSGQISSFLEDEGKKAIASGQYDELVTAKDELATKVTESETKLTDAETKVTELSDTIADLQAEVEALDQQNVELNFQLRSNAIDELISNKINLEVITDSEEVVEAERTKLFKLPFEALTSQVSEYRKLIGRLEDNTVNNKKKIEKVEDPTLSDSLEEEEFEQIENLSEGVKLTARQIRDALQSVKPDALNSLFFINKTEE